MQLSLDPELEAALTKLRAKLEVRSGIGRELDRILALLDAMPPQAITRVDPAIAYVGGLYCRHETFIVRALLPRRTDEERLRQEPRVAYLFLFHRDGRMREAALKRLDGGLPSPFWFAAVAWRLNDWAEPVREAAAACAARCFPRTCPEIVARCASALLIRRSYWSRWTSERELLDQVFARPDVIACLAQMLLKATTGPAATLLRTALRAPSLDPHLTRIAHEGVQPAVRAAALDVLLTGKAAWPSRFAYEWIDKSMGLRRLVLVNDERDLTVPVDRAGLIDDGLCDRSPFVRRVALEGVMRYCKGTPQARERASRLLEDQSPSVRVRAEFIMGQPVQ